MGVIERMAIAASNLRSSLNGVLLYLSQLQFRLLHYTRADRKIVTWSVAAEPRSKELAVSPLLPIPRS